MKNFDIERKGYNKREVDDYIASLSKQYDDKLEKSKQDAMQLQAELMQCKMELDTYHNKDDQISNALVVAVETAKEIESSAKTIYELEIKRVKVLYKKWNNILNEIKALYPEINNSSGITTLFNEFEDALNKILSKEVELSNKPSMFNNQTEKIYAKTLLSRMWGKNQVGAKADGQDIQTIKRADSETKEGIQQSFLSKDKANIDGEGDFEKFLKSEFDDFDSFQYKKTHKDVDVPTDRKSNYLSVLEQSINKSQEGDDDKFDMLEALKPKEDLMDIMKSFKLDD